jgi:hypothetical protein
LSCSPPTKTSASSRECALDPVGGVSVVGKAGSNLTFTALAWHQGQAEPEQHQMNPVEILIGNFWLTILGCCQK